MSESTRRLSVGLAAPALIIVAAALIVPLLRIIELSLHGDTGNLTWGNFAVVLGSPVERRAFLTTLELSTMTLGLCVLLGVPYAFAMVVAPRSLAAALTLAVTLPFWTALLVRTYIWLVILQRHGLVNSVLTDLGLEQEPLSLVNNFTGTVIGMTHIMLPIFILPTYSAMRSIEPALIRAAMSLGAGRLRTFFSVLLPLSVGGILSGALLVFVVSLGFFVTPSILGGGNVYVISGRIERNISNYGDWGAAGALGVLLLLLVGGILTMAFVVAAGRRGAAGQRRA